MGYYNQQNRRSGWGGMVILALILLIVVFLSGLALANADLLNWINAGAAADQVRSQTDQNNRWFEATLPLELEKAEADKHAYVARLNEETRLLEANNDNAIATRRAFSFVAAFLALLLGITVILVVAAVILGATLRTPMPAMSASNGDSDGSAPAGNVQQRPNPQPTAPQSPRFPQPVTERHSRNGRNWQPARLVRNEDSRRRLRQFEAQQRMNGTNGHNGSNGYYGPSHSPPRRDNQPRGNTPRRK